MYIHRSKRSISREYSLIREELPAIRAWIKERGQAPGPLFPSRQGRHGITRQRLDQLMKQYCNAAGNHGREGPHALAEEFVRDAPARAGRMRFRTGLDTATRRAPTFTCSSASAAGKKLSQKIRLEVQMVLTGPQCSAGAPRSKPARSRPLLLPSTSASAPGSPRGEPAGGHRLLPACPRYPCRAMKNCLYSGSL
jgi:hypothetical protein